VEKGIKQNEDLVNSDEFDMAFESDEMDYEEKMA